MACPPRFSFARPCLEPLEDRLAPAPLATSLAIPSIFSIYTPINQMETVTAKVTSTPGITVNQGQVVFTDGGQTQTANVHNGFATTTFAFPFLSQMPHAHTVTAAYSVPPGSTQSVNFDPSSAQATAPDTTLAAFTQFLVDSAIVYALFTAG
jgi:hypothetical protein